MNRTTKTIFALGMLFAACFFTLHWIYGYLIEFQSETNDTFFLLGGPFFREFLDHPGGAVRYAGRFLGQFYHHRWLGALIVAACITLFAFLLHVVLGKLSPSRSSWTFLIPSVLLLALHTSPNWLLQDTLGLCTSFAALLVYLLLAGAKWRWIWALTVTPVVYFAAGVYVWFLVIWIVIYELCDSGGGFRTRASFAVGYLVYVAAIPLVAWRWVYMIPLRSVWLCPAISGPLFRIGWIDQSRASRVLDDLLIVGFCAALLLVSYASRLPSRVTSARFGEWLSGRRGHVVVACVVCAALLLVHLIRYDAPLARIMAFRELYLARDWDALLAKARQVPYEDHRVQFMTNFALCQKGILLDEMFRYPQPWGARGVFMNFTGMRVPSPGEDDTANGMYNSDLLYELGHANYSLGHAYNCITMTGTTYQNLSRMAECNIVNGNYALARKYLNLLEQTFFHREYARRKKAMLEDPAAIEREYGALRARLPTVDGFGHPTAYFVTLLESKPDNRAALDCLLAWLLLDKTTESLQSICADIGHLRDVGRTTMPRHCQEALLVYAGLSKSAVDTQGFPFDRAVVATSEDFWRDLSGQGEWLDTHTARDLYGETYMHYWFFATNAREARRDSGAESNFKVTTREE